MRKQLVCVAAVLSLSAAGPVAAQACFGTPMVANTHAGVTADLGWTREPGSARLIGVHAARRLPFALAGSQPSVRLQGSAGNFQDAPGSLIASAQGRFVVPLEGTLVEPPLDICLAAGADYTRYRDDIRRRPENLTSGGLAALAAAVAISYELPLGPVAVFAFTTPTLLLFRERVSTEITTGAQLDAPFGFAAQVQRFVLRFEHRGRERAFGQDRRAHLSVGASF